MATKMVAVEGFQTVERWIDRLSPDSERTNRFILTNFIEYLRQGGGKFSTYTPDDLVEYQKNARSNGEEFEILDEVQRYINSLKDLRLSSLETYYAIIKSFFAHNRAELPRDRKFKPRSEIAPVRGLLAPEEIRDMVLSSKPRYRAVFLSMFQGGMGQEEWEYWNLNGWEATKRQLDDKVSPLKIDLPGRKMLKHKKPYYTFIGSDAIDALRHYVEHVRPDRDDAIFFDQYGKPMTKTAVREYWRRQSYKMGLVILNKTKDLREMARTRHGKGLHEMRDTFRTLWSKAGALPFVGEFIMGHDIDPLNYDKSSVDVDFYRDAYVQAEDMLNLMSSDRAYGKVDIDQVKKQAIEIEELKTTIQRLQNGQGDVESLRAENREIRAQMQEIWQLLKKKPKGI